MADRAGIGLKGIRIKIDRNGGLLRKGVYGFTNGRTITLYLDAFANPETLVKTLGHEKMHVYQVNILGNRHLQIFWPNLKELHIVRKRIDGYIIY